MVDYSKLARVEQLLLTTLKYFLRHAEELAIVLRIRGFEGPFPAAMKIE